MAGSDRDAAAGRSEGLVAQGIVKRYGLATVLRGVDIAIRPGKVVGLVGHNGAGKSTLLKTLAGAIVPDGGTLHVDGTSLLHAGPSDALAAGVSTVYQELSLHLNLTVVQNVFLGRELTKGGKLDRARMREEARELVSQFDLDIDVDRPLSHFPVAVRQLLEVAVACGRDARYLLLDEPTTSLEGGQVTRLLDQVNRLASEGMGILLIDHKLDELYAVADDIVVLVDGEVRISGEAGELDRSAIVTAIAGDDAAEHLRAAAMDKDKVEPIPLDQSPLLKVRGLHAPGVTGVNLDAYAGRVLGIYGLVGSGRTELMRALVGLSSITAGTVEMDGEAFTPRSPSHAQRHGLVYLTEERKVDGIIPGLDSVVNVALPVVGKFTKAGVLDKRAMRQTAQRRLDELGVRGDRTGAVANLSGGNQQKVLFARALEQGPRVLLLDEPTKGVDIGVKSQIHRMLRSLARESGLAVVVVSSEEEEILDVADDVVTFAGGASLGEARTRTDYTLASLREAAWSAA